MFNGSLETKPVAISLSLLGVVDSFVHINLTCLKKFEPNAMANMGMILKLVILTTGHGENEITKQHLNLEILNYYFSDVLNSVLNCSMDRAIIFGERY